MKLTFSLLRIRFADAVVHSAKYLKDKLRVKRIGEAKARGEGARAKRPLVLIPGVYSSVLDVWDSHEKPEWLREKLWIDLGKVGFWSGKDNRANANLTDEQKRAQAKEFVRHMMPAADGCSDPPGIKVRPKAGIAGIDFLTEGFFKDSSTVYGLMIRVRSRGRSTRRWHVLTFCRISSMLVTMSIKSFLRLMIGEFLLVR